MRAEVKAGPGPGQHRGRRCLVGRPTRHMTGSASIAETIAVRIELVTETSANDIDRQIAAASGRGSWEENDRKRAAARIAEIIMQVFEAGEPIGVKHPGLGTDTGNPPEPPTRVRGR